MKKPRRAYIDSNVIIYGLLEECNSRLVLFLAQIGEFEVIVSELVVEEVERFFKENYSREAGYLAKKFVELLSCRIVTRKEISEEVRRYSKRIKAKDAENLASVKHEDIDHLVSYDEDYVQAGVEEYTTPKQFVKLSGMKLYDMNY